MRGKAGLWYYNTPPILYGDVAYAQVDSSFPIVYAYPFSSSGFGTKYSDPVGGGLQGYAVRFSANNIAIGTSTTPFIQAYPWSSGFGTKYSNPASLPPSRVTDCMWYNESELAMSSNASPYIIAYVWSSGFGTKYSDPAVLPTGVGNGVAFRPDGSAVAVAHATSPRITAYPFTSGSGFGTKYSNPATLPPNNGNGVRWSLDGNDIGVVNQTTSPRIRIYPWSSGFGTAYSNPATALTGSGNQLSFSSNDVFIAHSGSPYISAYPFTSGSGFGTKYSNPATLPTANGLAIYANDSQVFFGQTSSSNNTQNHAYPFTSGSGFGTKYSDPAVPANSEFGQIRGVHATF